MKKKVNYGSHSIPQVIFGKFLHESSFLCHIETGACPVISLLYLTRLPMVCVSRVLRHVISRGTQQLLRRACFLIISSYYVLSCPTNWSFQCLERLLPSLFSFIFSLLWKLGHLSLSGCFSETPLVQPAGASGKYLRTGLDLGLFSIILCVSSWQFWLSSWSVRSLSSLLPVFWESPCVFYRLGI